MIDPKLKDTCDELLRRLYGYSAYSAGSLVLNVLVHWGDFKRKEGRFDNARDVGTLFINAFDTPAEELVQSSSTPIRESKNKWNPFDEVLPEVIGYDLAAHPFEDSLPAFIDVIHEWFRESSFDITREETGSTKEEIIHQIIRNWFYNIW